MGKKKTAGNLGKALIKDRFGHRRNARREGDSYLHTSELNDGYDWGRLNLQSVTEESSFQEFLSTAELAGTEFQAEKLNIKFVSPKSQVGLLSAAELESVLASQEKNKSLLKIPRRPTWGPQTTAEELRSAENESFLDWRRQLAALQEVEQLLLTPYEKNLEFWRHLWRVIERSDVIVQIVDARNPLLFRCPDLESYVREVDHAKLNMILLNKADYLTDEQRQAWADYFAAQGVKVAFFSATKAVEMIKEEAEEEQSEDEEESDSDSSCSSYNTAIDRTEGVEEDIEEMVAPPRSEEGETEETGAPPKSQEEETGKKVAPQQLEEETEEAVVPPKSQEEETAKTVAPQQLEEETEEAVAPSRSQEETKEPQPEEPEGCAAKVVNSPDLLDRDQLIALFKTVYEGKTCIEGTTTIGLVGYPNVGKSSTINALMLSKSVSVSATPGKTKHFQTLYLDKDNKDLMLCDCPGLVMPSFISTKAEMILNGILPIDQMRDHVPPMNLLGTLIPRHVIEDTYGIRIPPPAEGEDPERPPHSEEILNAYGYNRGFMTQNGQPDNPRSSRYLLKDFVNGRLLYCVAPPGVDQASYHKFPARSRALPRHVPPATLRATKGSSVDADRDFRESGVHFKGRVAPASGSGNPDKPWKKHGNRNKREKLRRLHRHLDLH